MAIIEVNTLDGVRVVRVCDYCRAVPCASRFCSGHCERSYFERLSTKGANVGIEYRNAGREVWIDGKFAFDVNCSLLDLSVICRERPEMRELFNRALSTGRFDEPNPDPRRPAGGE